MSDLPRKQLLNSAMFLFVILKYVKTPTFHFVVTQLLFHSFHFNLILFIPVASTLFSRLASSRLPGGQSDGLASQPRWSLSP